MSGLLFGSQVAAEMEADRVKLPPLPVVIIAVLVLWAVGAIFLAVCGG